MSSATRINRSSLSPLVHSFSGSLLLPGDDGYETARRVHNGMIDRHPSVIARCVGTADVVNALDFAIKHGLARSIHAYTTDASPGRRRFARGEFGGGAGGALLFYR